MITEQQITADKASELRAASGLSQKTFWAAVGVQQSVGSRYEAGDTKIPKPVRMLIVATYVSPTGTALIDIKAVKTTAKQVRRDLDKVVDRLNAAREALTLVESGAA